MKEKKENISTRDLLKFSYVLIPLGLLLLYIYYSGENDEKLIQQQGVYAECVMVAYGEGRTGQRGPKKGYYNQFAYHIGDSIHYCYVFTSIKPLPFDTKLKVKYLQKTDGKVTIRFPVEYKERYKEYGFNDYGY